MKKKPSIIKKVISGIFIFIFIKVAIALFTIGFSDFEDLDMIYNIVFGFIVMTFILFKVFQKTKASSPTKAKKNNTTPPLLDNKPLHPK